MKKILFVAMAAVAMFSCGDAADGDPGTDTTSFSSPADESAAPVGDTSLHMDASTGTDTVSKPYSNPGSGRSAGDTASGTSGGMGR